MRNSGTIMVRLHPCLRSEIVDFEDKYNVEVNLVSSLMSRYAVEVLPGREDEYVDLLQNDPLVMSVNPYYLKAQKFIPRIITKKDTR